MNKAGYLTLAVFFACFVAAAVSYRVGAQSIGNWIAVPALLISGWGAVGHLVTVDDDKLGEWSNPSGSRPFWRRSLLALILKFSIAGAFLWLLISRP
jgi:hypothetical protein